jgi:hypothetical protein
MAVRQEIRELAALGQFPLEERTQDQNYLDLIACIEAALPKIAGPVTDEEARVLASLFPSEGTTFGLAWELLYLIETAPNWPLADVLDGTPENEWTARLRTRYENSKIWGRGRPGR